MPARAARPCSVPGCPETTTSKWAQCPRHQRKAPKAARGYGKTWESISAQYLRLHPWCAVPECIRLATTTDHIDGDTSHNAWSNLRGLCRYHHGQRTWRDQPGGAALDNQ